jgi:PAS domain S-box-containing protein
MRESNDSKYQRPLRLLIAEDNKRDAELIVAALKRAGYPVWFEVVDTPDEFRSKLVQEEFDLVLCDHNLTAWSGADALKIVSETGRAIPFIVVTGSLGDEAAVEYIKSGAADYVLKSRLGRLPAAVGQALRDREHREEEVRLHEQVQAGKRDWELTFDSVPDPILVLDRERLVRRANRAAGEMLGLSFSEIIGRPCDEVIHGPSGVCVDCPHQRALQGGRESWGIIDDQKAERVFDAHCSPLYDSGGQVSGFVFSMHDITERKRAEDEIRKLSRAVEQSPVSVVITEPNGNIEYVNPRFTEMTGYTLEEVGGKNPRLLRSNETSPQEYEKLWRTIASGREWQGEFHNRRKDGTLFWARASISPIRNEAGAVSHFVAVEEDITAQRMMEEQLRLAQKMEAVGRLAGGVAHDFNNLLTVINGHAQLLMEQASPQDPQYSHLREILKGGERAAGLTRQLLTFSRKQVLSLRSLDLNAVIGDIQKMLRRLIGEDVELQIKAGSQLGPVMADPGQIEQIVMNLAVNARDAMPRGGRLMIETANASLDERYVQAHPGATPGRYVMLAVRDTGHGMDARTLANAFEPFFTTKEPGKGTGLGLATVYGIVTQFAGHISVESEMGQGTTFHVYLPRLDQKAGAREEKEEPRGDVSGSETILVVEDETGVRSLIQAALESKGYRALVAGDSEEAERIAGRHQGPLDLLLTDVIMPGRNGKALAESLASSRPGLKVLYISGYTADVIGHHGVLESGVSFLPKPFTSSSLLRKVREVLEK